MLTIVDVKNKKAEAIWENIPSSAYNFPFHDFSIYNGILKSKRNIYLCYEKKQTDFLFSVFEVNTSYAKCFFLAEPIISSNIEFLKTELYGFIYKIHSFLKVAIYFPLVYKDTVIGNLLLQNKKFTFWDRLYSPTINNESREKSLIERAFERIGKRAERRIKKFEGLNSEIKRIYFSEAEDILTEIENNSWKKKLHQDLTSRNQLSLYSSLVKSKNAHLRVAFVEKKPIAYRLDYKINKTVYALKWSFSELYKKYSPGFYLLVKDLDDYWNNYEVTKIDLFGSPDTLKQSISDLKSFQKRLDIGYSKEDLVLKTLKKERLNHDQKIYENFKANKSIKTLYEKP